MAVSLRAASADDFLTIQNCNLTYLPENYQMKYYDYHYLSWPQLLYTAENDANNLVGYVLAKMEDDVENRGHITSLGVARNQRKMGVGKRLISLSHDAMDEACDATHSYLHVRVSNRAGTALYSSLGYKKDCLNEMYYADGEDAIAMKYTIREPDLTQNRDKKPPRKPASKARPRR